MRGDDYVEALRNQAHDIISTVATIEFLARRLEYLEVLSALERVGRHIQQPRAMHGPHGAPRGTRGRCNVLAPRDKRTSSCRQ